MRSLYKGAVFPWKKVTVPSRTSTVKGLTTSSQIFNRENLVDFSTMCGQDGQSLIHGQSWQNDDSSVPKQSTDTEKSIHCDIYIL